MKKTLITLAACAAALSAPALAETVDIALHTGSPTAQNIGNNQNDNMPNILGLQAKKTPGLYLAANNGNVALGGGNEGVVTAVTENGVTTYSMTTFSRSGAGGESVTQVIVNTGLKDGYALNSLTFGYTGVTGSVTSNYRLGVGLYDAEGNMVKKETVSGKGATGGEVKVTFDTPITWSEGSYKIVATVYQPGGNGGTNISTMSGITLKADVSAPTLTKITVTGASYIDDTLTLTVGSLAGVTGNLNVLTTDASWSLITEAIGGDMYKPVDVTLTDGDISFGLASYTGGSVKFNGSYVGETGGKYVTAYIPEPSTATFSLLALAGLAVRRRRK